MGVGAFMVAEAAATRLPAPVDQVGEGDKNKRGEGEGQDECRR
jgi:hypothetical protein